MIAIIGGKCDGQLSPVKTLTLQEGDESYLLMSFKEGGITHRFFMLAGMQPAEAQRVYKVREGMVKPMLLGRPDEESELGELNQAVRDLPRMSPEEIEAHPAFQPPGDLRPGEYRSKSGAVIYPDSEVMTSYIGSAQEELDAKEAARKARFPGAVKKTGAGACDRCFGWGFMADPDHKCTKCKGRGSV